MTTPRSLTAILVSACLAALPALSHADDVDTPIKALAAPPRRDQPLADKGRRAQVQKLIDTLSADK